MDWPEMILKAIGIVCSAVVVIVMVAFHVDPLIIKSVGGTLLTLLVLWMVFG